ncbi:MAG: tripartite tricarboxylate transporter substrate binding protein [Beijerinckiaceae bacterium]|nr:tripartite tricarboxylate transporter substrate binding protein [Beijerinckiaceae bacterium]
MTGGILQRTGASALISALCLFSATALSTQSASAQAGAGQLTLLVGFAAGGSADSIARIVGARLGEKLGRNVVVENRPGAGANIATKTVVQAQPDGNTLLVTTAALPINETLYKNKGFSAPSLMPISIVATTPEVFAINVDDKAKTLSDFVTQNKGKEIHFATAGIGTGSHIAGEYFFKFLAKANAKHIPFRGGPDATNAVLGGHVPMVISSLSGFAAQVAGGKLRGLAVATEARNPVIKDVPTFGEVGYPGFTSLSWVGFFAPPGTSKDKVAEYNKHIDDISKEPAIVEKLKALGFDTMNGGVPVAEAFMTKEYAHWKKLVEALELRID